MTLLLTELSDCGIIMGSDSAISYMKHGEIEKVDEVGWQKVIKFHHPRSLIGYWGAVGEITGKRRFDKWIDMILKGVEFESSAELADFIAKQLNIAAGQEPIANCLGIHVASYGLWPDVNNRPMFFHVNNGDGQYRITTHRNPNTNCILCVEKEWVAGLRRLFESNQDFPSQKRTIEQNLRALKEPYITRNGHFFTYLVFWQQISEAMKFTNLVPGLCIPKSPHELGPRRGLMNLVLKFMIDIQKLSSEWNIVGGKANCAALDEDGFLH